jgi:hypothetical protein
LYVVSLFWKMNGRGCEFAGRVWIRVKFVKYEQGCVGMLRVKLACSVFLAAHSSHAGTVKVGGVGRVHRCVDAHVLNLV